MQKKRGDFMLKYAWLLGLLGSFFCERFWFCFLNVISRDPVLVSSLWNRFQYDIVNNGPTPPPPTKQQPRCRKLKVQPQPQQIRQAQSSVYAYQKRVVDRRVWVFGHPVELFLPRAKKQCSELYRLKMMGLADVTGFPLVSCKGTIA